MSKPKWKFELVEKGIKFSINRKYRGEIITGEEIPPKCRVELARILLIIINSYIEDKESPKTQENK